MAVINQRTPISNRFTVQGMVEAGDNETQIIHRFTKPGRVLSVMFDTESALGANLSADLVDGGSDGTGTDVIQASTDNLNGVEEKVLAAASEQPDGDYLNLTIDNLAAGVTVRASVEIEEHLPG